MLARTRSRAPRSRTSAPMLELEHRRSRLQRVSRRLPLSGQLNRCGVWWYRCCLPRLLADYNMLGPTSAALAQTVEDCLTPPSERLKSARGRFS